MLKDGKPRRDNIAFANSDCFFYRFDVTYPIQASHIRLKRRKVADWNQTISDPFTITAILLFGKAN